MFERKTVAFIINFLLFLNYLDAIQNDNRNSTPTCELPKDFGVDCKKARTEKYFYDLSSNECEPFKFRGCSGNLNRFDTFDKCWLKCGDYNKSKDDDATSNCEKHLDTDVRGNDIRTVSGKSVNDCCKLCSDETKCKAYAWSGKSCYLKSSDSPITFKQGVTLGILKRVEKHVKTTIETKTTETTSTTRVNTIKTPEEEYSCGDPLSPGPCRAAIPRFYYDTRLNECKKYDDGGCGKYKNNFPKQEICEQWCVKEDADSFSFNTTEEFRNVSKHV